MAVQATRYVRVQALQRVLCPALNNRSFVAGWAAAAGKEAQGGADSAAHAVGDTIEKAGENLKQSAKESKESGDSKLGSQVKNAAESVGDATAKAGDKIEHSMEGDEKSNTRLNKKNLEDKQVLSN